MKYKRCKGCEQPIKPGRHKKDEYQHASGCPFGRSAKKKKSKTEADDEKDLIFQLGYVTCAIGFCLMFAARVERYGIPKVKT